MCKKLLQHGNKKVLRKSSRNDECRGIRFSYLGEKYHSADLGLGLGCALL